MRSIQEGFRENRRELPGTVGKNALFVKELMERHGQGEEYQFDTVSLVYLLPGETEEKAEKTPPQEEKAREYVLREKETLKLVTRQERSREFYAKISRDARLPSGWELLRQASFKQQLIERLKSLKKEYVHYSEKAEGVFAQQMILELRVLEKNLKNWEQAGKSQEYRYQKQALESTMRLLQIRSQWERQEEQVLRNIRKELIHRPLQRKLKQRYAAMDPEKCRRLREEIESFWKYQSKERRIELTEEELLKESQRLLTELLEQKLLTDKERSLFEKGGISRDQVLRDIHRELIYQQLQREPKWQYPSLEPEKYRERKKELESLLEHQNIEKSTELTEEEKSLRSIYLKELQNSLQKLDGYMEEQSLVEYAEEELFTEFKESKRLLTELLEPRLLTDMERSLFEKGDISIDQVLRDIHRELIHKQLQRELKKRYTSLEPEECRELKKEIESLWKHQDIEKSVRLTEEEKNLRGICLEELQSRIEEAKQHKEPSSERETVRLEEIEQEIQRSVQTLNAYMEEQSLTERMTSTEVASLLYKEQQSDGEMKDIQAEELYQRMEHSLDQKLRSVLRFIQEEEIHRQLQSVEYIQSKLQSEMEDQGQRLEEAGPASLILPQLLLNTDLPVLAGRMSILEQQAFWKGLQKLKPEAVHLAEETYPTEMARQDGFQEKEKLRLHIEKILLCQLTQEELEKAVMRHELTAEERELVYRLRKEYVSDIFADISDASAISGVSEQSALEKEDGTQSEMDRFRQELWLFRVLEFLKIQEKTEEKRISKEQQKTLSQIEIEVLQLWQPFLKKEEQEKRRQFSFAADQKEDMAEIQDFFYEVLPREFKTLQIPDSQSLETFGVSRAETDAVWKQIQELSERQELRIFNASLEGKERFQYYQAYPKQEEQKNQLQQERIQRLEEKSQKQEQQLVQMQELQQLLKEQMEQKKDRHTGREKQLLEQFQEQLRLERMRRGLS